MKVRLTLYRKDPNLPSPVPGKGKPGLPYPVDVELGSVPNKGDFMLYGKERQVLKVITVANPDPGESVAIVLVA